MEINKLLESERLSKMIANEHQENKVQQLKNVISEAINTNSVFSNLKANNMRISSNLIDFNHRVDVFRNWDKKACKMAKKAWKEANDTKGRSELIGLILEYSKKGYSSYNAKFTVLN